MEAIQSGVSIAVFFVVLFAVHRILDRMGVLDRRKKLVEQAIRQGHVVRAELEPKSVMFRTETNAKNEQRYVWVGRYVYEVNGKRYKKVEGKMYIRPPQSLTLYYLDNPAKAFTAGEAGKKGSAFWRILSILIPLILAAMVYNLFE